MCEIYKVYRAFPDAQMRHSGYISHALDTQSPSLSKDWKCKKQALNCACLPWNLVPEWTLAPRVYDCWMVSQAPAQVWCRHRQSWTSSAWFPPHCPKTIFSSSKTRVEKTKHDRIASSTSCAVTSALFSHKHLITSVLFHLSPLQLKLLSGFLSYELLPRTRWWQLFNVEALSGFSCCV